MVEGFGLRQPDDRRSCRFFGQVPAGGSGCRPDRPCVLIAGLAERGRIVRSLPEVRVRVSPRRKSLRGHVLKGYEPSVVRTSGEAYALSERLFSRLGSFEFDSSDDNRLISSGPQSADRSIRLVSSTGHRIAIDDDDKLSVLFPYRGVIQVARSRTTAIAHASEVLVVAPGGRETRLSPGYLGVLVQFSAEDARRLSRRWQDAGGEAFEPGLTRVRDDAALDYAHAMIDALERPATGSAPSWTDHVASLWEAIALASEARGRSVTPRASLAQVQRAEDFMAARFGEPLTLSDVSRAVGVGPRALQLAFHRHRRSSPLKFLHHRRLEEARRRLSQPGSEVTVTTVAYECGFTHLGRFAEDYRRAFGEPPSRAIRSAVRAVVTGLDSLSG
jgi:AraC-like DNA-binding protein